MIEVIVFAPSRRLPEAPRSAGRALTETEG